MKHCSDKLVAMNACSEAVQWARKQRSAAAAWKNCKRPDWMLWLIGRTDDSKPYSNERKPLVRVACECARLAWQQMPQASRDALEVFEQWADGKATEAQCRAAWSAAYASRSAAYAARSASDAAWSAAYAADAAYAARSAAYAARSAAYAARSASDAKCAAIVRKHFPKAPRLP